MTHQINLTAAWKRVGENIRERHFNWVAEIESSEQIFLVFKNVESMQNKSVFLNDSELGFFVPNSEEQEFEITNLIEQKNRIRVQTENSPETKWSRVYLAIR